MRTGAGLILVALLLVPVAIYFWYFRYPKEAQRQVHGEYSVVALVSPTRPAFPTPLATHNNTTVTIALYEGKVKLAERELVSNEDLPEDHLPVSVVWAGSSVTVTEPKGGRSLTFTLPRNSTAVSGATPN